MSKNYCVRYIPSYIPLVPSPYNKINTCKQMNKINNIFINSIFCLITENWLTDHPQPNRHSTCQLPQKASVPCVT